MNLDLGHIFMCMKELITAKPIEQNVPTSKVFLQLRSPSHIVHRFFMKQSGSFKTHGTFICNLFYRINTDRTKGAILAP